MRHDKVVLDSCDALLMLPKINRVVGIELRRYPRGKRGSAQNVFRAVYQMVRASSLGHKEPWSGSASECEALATILVRETHPHFVPAIRA
jgi:hypothetical protein